MVGNVAVRELASDNVGVLSETLEGSRKNGKAVGDAREVVAGKKLVIARLR